MKKNIIYISSLILLISCQTKKKVIFETYIDTNNKSIEIQTKRTFEIKNLNIYASNQFDGARLNNFEKLNDSTVVAYITPENTPINNSAYYAFSIWSKVPRTIYLSFKYPPGYSHRYRPKIKINNKWSLIDTLKILNKKNNTLVKLELSAIPQIIAAQKIESSKDVKKWYQEMIKKNSNTLNYKTVGKTALGRDIPVLFSDNSKHDQKDIIVLLTRQHPPETTGYYAFQYFIGKILEDTQISKKFLDKYQIIAFPIMNPDGVDLGHWRHNTNGIDLNRDWSYYNQPEIKHAVNFIEKKIKKNKSVVILGLDFHSTWYDIFYTNEERKETTLPNFIDDWFKNIENKIANYKIKEASQNSKKPVSKGWFLNRFNATGITFEIGDNTSDKKIKELSEVAALEMMNILLLEK
jgi:hypothetical protein